MFEKPMQRIDEGLRSRWETIEEDPTSRELAMDIEDSEREIARHPWPDDLDQDEVQENQDLLEEQSQAIGWDDEPLADHEDPNDFEGRAAREEEQSAIEEAEYLRAELAQERETSRQLIDGGLQTDADRAFDGLVEQARQMYRDKGMWDERDVEGHARVVVSNFISNHSETSFRHAEQQRYGSEVREAEDWIKSTMDPRDPGAQRFVRSICMSNDPAAALISAYRSHAPVRQAPRRSASRASTYQSEDEGFYGGDAGDDREIFDSVMNERR